MVFITSALGAKRLDLLRQIAPKAMTIAFLMRPNTAESEIERRDVQNAAQAFGQQLITVGVTQTQYFLLKSINSLHWRPVIQSPRFARFTSSRRPAVS